VNETKDEGSRLTEAAQALEVELRRYEELAVVLRRERLDTEKNLRRAAQALTALRESDARLGEHVQALVAAIGAARERQQANAEVVQAQANRIRERSESLTGLLGRWQTLGDDAGQVNRLIQRLATDRRESNGSGEASGLAAAFDEVDARLGQLAEDAQTLSTSAEAEGFADLGRQAESLRLQLLSARNKLRTLQPKP
jgi:chromosome segregation ATPase